MPLTIKTINPSSNFFFYRRSKNIPSTTNRKNDRKNNSADNNAVTANGVLKHVLLEKNGTSGDKHIPSSPCCVNRAKFPFHVFRPSPLVARPRRSNIRPLPTAINSNVSSVYNSKIQTMDNACAYEGITIQHSPDKLLIKLMETNRTLRNKIEKLAKKVNYHLQLVEINKTNAIKIKKNIHLEKQIEDELQDLEEEYTYLKRRNAKMKEQVAQTKHTKNGTVHDLEHQLFLLNIQFKKHQKENAALKYGVGSQTKSLMKELDVINHYRERQNFMQEVVCKYKKEVKKQSKPSLAQSKVSIELRSLQEEQLYLNSKLVLLKYTESRKLDGKNTNIICRDPIAEKEEIMMFRALGVLKKSIASRKKKQLHVIKMVNNKIDSQKKENIALGEKLRDASIKSKMLNKAIERLVKTLPGKK